MAVNIRASGSTIIWTAWESIPGLMVVAIWANTRMIKSTDMVSTNGPTEDSISVTGCAESNMASEYTKPSTPISSTASGKRVNV